MKKPLFYLSLFMALTIAGIVFTQDLKQKNDEKLFLTMKGLESYELFQKQFSQKGMVVGKASKENLATIKKMTSSYCEESCSLLTARDLPSPLDVLLTLKSEDSLDDQAFVLLQTRAEGEVVIKNLIRRFLKQGLISSKNLSGVPYTNVLLDQYSHAVKTTLFPLLFISLFILLTFYLKSLIRALFVFIPGLAAASLALTATKIIYGHSHLITSIVPLLLFVIQLSLVLHILFSATDLKSVKHALKDKREPIFLMSVTTFIGFGALSFSNLTAISHFGALTAGLIVLSTLFTLLWVYLVSRYEKNLPNLIPPASRRPFKELASSHPFQKLFQLFQFGGTFWNDKTNMAVAFSAIMIGLLSFPSIPIVTDATQYFPKESGVREGMINVSQDIMGTPILEVIIPLEEPLTMPFLKKIWEAEKELSQKLPGDFFSSNRFVSLANKAYSGVEDLPSHQLSYHTLFSKVPASLKEGYDLEKGYRLTYLYQPVGNSKFEAILKTIKSHLQKEDLPFEFNGLYFQLMSAQKEMIQTLFESFSISLIIIATLAFLYFRKSKLFFIFLGVNTIPVLASFPFLYLFGLSFNIATVMTYSISLGLIVDSSFHIIHALNKKDITSESFNNGVARPIMGASFLLAICFSLFSLHGFLPIREFGLVLALIILLGMVMDLKTLPSLYIGKTSLPSKNDTL